MQPRVQAVACGLKPEQVAEEVTAWFPCEEVRGPGPTRTRAHRALGDAIPGRDWDNDCRARWRSLDPTRRVVGFVCAGEENHDVDTLS